jgi:hypothetical protein
MKTTIDIADGIYRQVKARAALEGQTVKAFLLEALKEKLTARRRGGPEGWRAVYGKGDKKVAEEVQRIIDEEFSRIDPKDWQ